MLLQVGMQLCHHGIPMELLWRISERLKFETWMIRPLFVTKPDRAEQFGKSGDSVTFLHSKRVQ
jgi:hypothetical protein